MPPVPIMLTSCVPYLLVASAVIGAFADPIRYRPILTGAGFGFLLCLLSAPPKVSVGAFFAVSAFCALFRKKSK